MLGQWFWGKWIWDIGTWSQHWFYIWILQELFLYTEEDGHDGDEFLEDESDTEREVEYFIMEEDQDYD